MKTPLITLLLLRKNALLLALSLTCISVLPARALTIELVTTFTYGNSQLTMPTGINDNGQVTGLFVFGHDGRGFIRNSDGTFLPRVVEPNDSGGLTEPTGINNSPMICGFFSSSPVHTRGFFFRNGAYTEFDVPGSFNGTQIYGVNDAGDFIGHYDAAGGSESFMFIDVAGQLTTFDVPSHTAYAALPRGINNNQEVVGTYEDYSGGNSYSFGFYRDAEGNIIAPLSVAPRTDTTLAAINDKGQIVGSYGTFRSYHAVLMTLEGELVTYDYPGAKSTGFTGINNNGDICGWYKADGNNGAIVGFIAHVTE
jgi:uncharacterized membrane protein